MIGIQQYFKISYDFERIFQKPIRQSNNLVKIFIAFRLECCMLKVLKQRGKQMTIAEPMTQTEIFRASQVELRKRYAVIGGVNSNSAEACMIRRELARRVGCAS